MGADHTESKFPVICLSGERERENAESLESASPLDRDINSALGCKIQGLSVPNHHIIPQQIGNVFSNFFIDVGFVINNPANILPLPNNLQIAQATGDALHLGSHPAYSNFVRDLVSQIQDTFRADFNNPSFSGDARRHRITVDSFGNVW